MIGPFKNTKKERSTFYMKNFIKMFGIIALAAMLGLAMTGCKNPTNSDPALTGTVTITGTVQ